MTPNDRTVNQAANAAARLRDIGLHGSDTLDPGAGGSFIARTRYGKRTNNLTFARSVAQPFFESQTMSIRVPQATKKLRGTTRKDRDTAPEPQARLTVTPRPPTSLSAAARAEWRTLAPILVAMGTLRGADLRALRLLCETLASAESFAATIAKEGVAVPAGSGSVKTHPAVQALATARAQARGLLADFGLTPRARESVAAAPGGREPNPYAKFKVAGD